jgi:hypothetical protein
MRDTNVSWLNAIAVGLGLLAVVWLGKRRPRRDRMSAAWMAQFGGRRAPRSTPEDKFQDFREFQYPRRR